MAIENILKHEQKQLTSSQISTLQIPAFGKINSLFLYFQTSLGASVTEAQIRSEIGNIRLTINGRDIIIADAVQLLDLYETLGVNVAENTGVAGVIELNLGRLLYIDPVARQLFGWGTRDVSSIQVQVTAGTLTAIDNVTAFTARTRADENFGAHTRFLNYPQSFNSTGEHTVDTLPRNSTTRYLGLLVDDGASGTISQGTVRVNNNTVMENVPLNVNKALLANSRYVQPAGYFVYMFANGSLENNLPMDGITDFRIITNFSVAPGAGGYKVAALSLEGVASPRAA